MHKVKVYPGIEHAPHEMRGIHLAIGMFDGVHLGHQAVIEAAIHSAKRTGGTCGLLTFWPHPSALVQPERRTRLIMDPSTKQRVLAKMGIGFIIEQNFGPDFAQIPAESFLPLLQKTLPGLVGIYVGENWRFGAGRRGDATLLLSSAKALGLSLFSAPRVLFNGEPISSTRIRAALSSGQIDLANTLLGYSYFSEGEVQPGRRLGRTIGFPTLNLAWEPELQPAYGVYAVRVHAPGRKHGLPGVANYGLRPTVGDAKSPLLEVHLLEDCPFQSGDTLQVEWLRFLRPERRFSNLEELKVQIQKDTESAKFTG